MVYDITCKKHINDERPADTAVAQDNDFDRGYYTILAVLCDANVFHRLMIYSTTPN